MNREERTLRQGPYRPDSCPHRSCVRLRGAVEVARCGVLEEVLGKDDEDLVSVGRDACDACSQNLPPTETRINPVVASFLYTGAGRIIAQGGTTSIDVGTAAGIRGWAEKNLANGASEPDESLIELARRGVARECYYHPGETNADVSSHFECLHAEHGRKAPSECRRCRDWSADGKAPDRVSIPAIRSPHGPAVRKWAVGLTTSPRARPTVDLTLDSLLRAGWNDVRVFMDGAVELPERHQTLPLSQRDPQIGAWPSYYLGLQELLEEHPDADAYFMSQDDVIYHDTIDLRAYLERSLWPGGDGIVSLYCSSAYAKADSGWFPRQELWVWGALAFIFSRRALEGFLEDEDTRGHRSLYKIDVCVGRWAQKTGRDLHYPCPSLAQHIGHASTIWPASGARGARKADQFAGSLPEKARRPTRS